MKTKLSASLLGLFLCLPCLHAQGLKAELDLLQKRRVAAIKTGVAPLDKKFTEAADAMIAAALKQGDTALADRIKRERLPDTGSHFRVNAFDDTYWKFTEGGFLSLYRIESNGDIEEVSYYPENGMRASQPAKWELVDATHIRTTNGKVQLKLEDGRLLRPDTHKWVPTDRATFLRFAACKDMRSARAVVDGE